MKTALKGAVPKMTGMFRILLALLVAAALIPITALMTPTQAYAAQGPPSVITGRFTLASWFSSSPAYTGDFPGTVTLDGGYEVYCFGDNSAGDNGRTRCISPGAANWGDPANANNRTGTVYATWHSDDPATGISWYRMTVTPDIQPAQGSAGVQYLGDTWLAIPWDFEGWIRLVKTSSKPDVTNANPDYSLAGAVYEVHRSSDGSLAATLVTDAGGEASSPALEAGSYYLVERTAPKGFVVDAASHGVTVTAGQTQTVAVADVPFGWVELQKASAKPTLTDGVADYSLQGATFALYRSSDGSLAATLITDVFGKATSPKVEPGSYYLVETGAPKGFLADATAHDITVIGGSGAKLTVKDEPLGWIELMKASANSEVTDNNGCYSLAGAVYGIYASSADALSDTDRASTITTDSSGYGRTPAQLVLGTWYAREITAPKGYAADTAVYTITHNKATTRLDVTDRPQGDPAAVLVGKIDADTTASMPQGAAGLAGAEFTIRYFDGYFDTAMSAEASGYPTRTWVIRTGTDGLGRLREASLAAGSDGLYHNSAGDATIPLGTVLVQETKAPEGYVLPDPAPVHVRQVTPSGTLENVQTYNAPDVPDNVMRGDISIIKAYNETPDDDTGQMTPEKGIIFDFFGSAQYEGTKPHAGTLPAFSLVTDERGYADTSAIHITQNPDGSYTKRARAAGDAGAVPYDTYLMVQRFSPDGFDPISPMLIQVNSDGATYSYLLQNGTIQTPLKVVKVDSETGAAVPYPAAWQIIEAATGKPVSMTVHYPTEQTLDVFVSDGQGNLTLPEQLPYGRYLLREVTAPAAGGTGYVRNPVDVPFIAEAGHDRDNPLEVTFKDAPAKGRILLIKTDAKSGEAVAGATYVVRAAGDIHTLDGTLRTRAGDVVDTVTTGADGTASSRELYLGTYTVTEAISPEGFALDTAHHSVTLSYEGQDVAVVTRTLELADNPTTLRIRKVDSLSGRPIAGVSFMVTNDATEKTYRVTTDGDGMAHVSYLAHGSYTVTELAVPFGYASNKDTHHFAIDDAGLIEGRDTFEITVENVPVQVAVSKTDITTDAELAGCGLEIYLADDNGDRSDEALFSWVSAAEPYVIAGGLAPGDYVLHETYPAPGYVTAADVVFTVSDNGAIQKVMMRDDITKVELSKTDITTGQELAGAHLSIWYADEAGEPTGEPLHEWTSGDAPCLIERLPQGEYILHEDGAPSGYATAADVPFTVSDTGETQRVVMEDDTLKVEVSKRDVATDEELPGAHLAIYPVYEDGEVKDAPLYEWISADEPYFIEGIAAGDYVLREDTAPSGYALSSEVSFTVSDTGEIQRVVMYDEPLPKIPDEPDEPTEGWDKTGSDMRGLAVLVALLATGALAGIALGIRRLCRSERVPKDTEAEATGTEAVKEKEASEE
jgi:uncharacterized surface anchored protein